MLSLAAAETQIRFYINALHQGNQLKPHQLLKYSTRDAENAIARTMLRGKKVTLAKHLFAISTIRSVQCQNVQSVLMWDRRLHSSVPLTAFVGHRFTPGVTAALRHNLQVLLGTYGVRLIYSDTDMPNGPIFDTILNRIAKCNFCIFDDRETEVRPNVLIEIGAAAALRKPYFYLNYQRKRSVLIGRTRERITSASDLAGMLHSPYSKYEDLFRELAARIPGFFRDRKLMVEDHIR